MSPFLLPGERMDEVNDRLRLIQKPDGLTFGTDALLLAAYVKKTHGMALELGGGSGIISLLLAARNKCKHITCCEVQPAYADLITRNVALNDLADKITPLCADMRDTAALGTPGSFHAVFSNPPYMTKESGMLCETEGKNVARHEVFGTIADFAATAARMLRYGGNFYVVYHPERLCDLLLACRAAKLEPKQLTMVHAHPSLPPSMLLLTCRLGGRPGLRVTKPLLLQQSTGENTTDLAYILEHGCMPNTFTQTNPKET